MSKQTISERPVKKRAVPSQTPHMLSVVIELLAVALATATVSAMLLRLSGTALWMPPSWRTMMFILVPLAGIFVYTFARHSGRWLRDGCVALLGPSGGSKKAERTRQHLTILSRIATAAVAVIAVTGALYAGVSINSLRERCTIAFTPPVPNWMSDEERAGYDWYWWEFGRATPLPTGISDREAIFASDLDPKLPNFLDRHHNAIYTPMYWPADVRARVALRGNGSFERGLAFTYENEPRWLIDQLRESEAAAVAYAETQWVFFWGHVAMIGFVAFAIGIVFEPAAWLAREFIGVF